MKIEICNDCGVAFVSILEEQDFNNPEINIGGVGNISEMRKFYPDEPAWLFPETPRCRQCNDLTRPIELLGVVKT